MTSEENKVFQKHCLKLELAGSATYKKSKQYQIVLSCKVCKFVYSVVESKRVCLVSL